MNRRIYDGVKRAKSLGKYKGRTYSVEKDIRKEYIQMMQSEIHRSISCQNG